MNTKTAKTHADDERIVDIVDDLTLRLGQAADVAYMIEQLAADRDEAHPDPLWAGLVVVGRQLGDTCLDASDKVSKLHDRIHAAGGAR